MCSFRDADAAKHALDVYGRVIGVQQLVQVRIAAVKICSKFSCLACDLVARILELLRLCVCFDTLGCAGRAIASTVVPHGCQG